MMYPTKMLVRQFSTTARFVSSFDSQCTQYITDQLGDWPVRLLASPGYGNGLFATRALGMGETVLRETPTARVSSTSAQTVQDNRVGQIASRMPLEWREDAQMLAQVLSLATQSPGWQPSGKPASHYLLSLRCLGYTELPECSDTMFVKDSLFQMLSEVYQLYSTSASMWNPSECMLLYNKIKSNAFVDSTGTSLFASGSMLNHSCRPNVIFNPYEASDLQAIRDIPDGEQLFISYNVSPQDLPELYGFKCNCEVCASA